VGASLLAPTGFALGIVLGEGASANIVGD